MDEPMTYTIFTLIFAGITALSTFAAFATCYIQYKTTRPKIKIKPRDELVDGTKPQSFFCVYNNISVALVSLDIQNISQIAGTVTDIYLEYGGRKYYCESIYKQYDTNITIDSLDSANTPLNTELTHFMEPMVVMPFFACSGFVLFHKFATIDSLNQITATLHYRIIGTKRTHRCTITLYRKTPVVTTL